MYTRMGAIVTVTKMSNAACTQAPSSCPRTLLPIPLYFHMPFPASLQVLSLLLHSAWSCMAALGLVLVAPNRIKMMTALAHLQSIDVCQSLSNCDIVVDSPHLPPTPQCLDGHCNQGSAELGEPEYAEQPDYPASPRCYNGGCLKLQACMRAGSLQISAAPGEVCSYGGCCYEIHENL